MPRKIYKKKKPQTFFTKNGKELKSYKDFNSVFSLQEATEELAEALPKEEIKNFDAKAQFQEVTAKVKAATKQVGNQAQELLERAKTADKVKISMVSLGINAALLIIVGFLVVNNRPSTRYTPKYSIFSSKPLTSRGASANLFGGDTRAATLDKIFGLYNCPLEGHGETFIEAADKNDIPYWLVASIAFQESSCGKNTPKLKAPGQEDVTDPNELEFIESYNAWGWGVWGKNLRTFESWDEGINRVSEYLGDTFFSKGITNTCEIMKIYTPPSDGSWCKGVNYFGNMIQNYSSPED
ncbi:hypothetical protein GF360_03530 [candidate division WWE3 bacterium]|nr:hypothetical protein [candidate division WWE3 bacterium]